MSERSRRPKHYKDDERLESTGATSHWPIDFGLRAGTRIGREILCLVQVPSPTLWHRLSFLSKADIRPQPRVFKELRLSHFSAPWLGVRLDRVYGASSLTNSAIDTFVRMNDQHVLTLVEAIPRGKLPHNPSTYI